MIKFEKVTLRYKQKDGIKTEKPALRDINLTIKEGEYVSLLGANGSGKSTMARLINGLLTPSKGKVSVDSLFTDDVDEIWNIRKKVGFVFQNPDNQIIASTVEEDVAFGPGNLGLPPAEIESRVRGALEFVGMLGYVKHEPHMLSGGQKQRVAVAGALAMRTKYLVLDEATSMLDTKSSNDLTALIKTLNNQYNLTIVNITHRPEETIGTDRIIILNSGEVVVDGTLREVYADAFRLKAYNVNVPRAKFLADRLKGADIDLPEDILTADELVDALCRSN